jgi:hypothetical protein
MPWNVWNVELAKWENLTSYATRAQAIGFRDEVVIPEKREGGPFEVRRTGAVLEEHGTKLMQLKPSMIWRCAMDDLDRRKHNELILTEAGTDRAGEFKHYAFHRRHVKKAGTANDIIRAAIAEPGIGLASGKRDTRLLYSDVELLKAALQ